METDGNVPRRSLRMVWKTRSQDIVFDGGDEEEVKGREDQGTRYFGRCGFNEGFLKQIQRFVG